MIHALEDNLTSDEEFALLYDMNRSSNLDLPCRQYAPFNLDDMENDERLAEF